MSPHNPNSVGGVHGFADNRILHRYVSWSGTLCSSWRVCGLVHCCMSWFLLFHLFQNKLQISWLFHFGVQLMCTLLPTVLQRNKIGSHLYCTWNYVLCIVLHTLVHFQCLLFVVDLNTYNFQHLPPPFLVVKKFFIIFICWYLFWEWKMAIVDYVSWCCDC